MNKEKKKFLAIRLDRELHYRIKVKALEDKLTIQEWFEKLIIESLGES